MHRDSKNGWLYTTYYGLPELMECAADSVERDALLYKRVPTALMLGRKGNMEWCGRAFRSWKEVRTSAQTAWKSGLETVAKMREELLQSDIPSPIRRSRKREWSEDDGEVNVDRVIEGDSYCFEQVRRRDTTGSSVLTILVDPGGNCKRTVEQLFWRPAAALILCELLEESGYQCEIVAWHKSEKTWTSGPHRNHAKIVRLKEAGETLDISYLVNGLSPWAFRGGFLGSDHIPGYTIEESYGYPVHHLNETDLEMMDLDQSTRAFQMRADVFNKNSAIEAAKDIITQIGQGAAV